MPSSCRHAVLTASCPASEMLPLLTSACLANDDASPLRAGSHLPDQRPLEGWSGVLRTRAERTCHRDLEPALRRDRRLLNEPGAVGSLVQPPQDQLDHPRVHRAADVLAVAAQGGRAALRPQNDADVINDNCLDR